MSQNVNIIELAKVAPDVNVTVRVGDLIIAARELVAMERARFEEERAAVSGTEPEQTVDRATALSMLNIKTRQTLNRWDRIGYLHPFKVGGVNRWRLSDIVAIINKRTSSTTI